VLVEQADLQPGHRVLEVGCGTGTLLMLITQAQAAVDVTGLDPDVKALARAKRKADVWFSVLPGLRSEVDQSIWSERASQSSSAKCIRSQAPARCQSRRRRQHVIPDPHPSSCGSIC
jgi:SAM-dependent methyltransferase